MHTCAHAHTHTQHTHARTYVLQNLGICAILILCCAFSESRNCLPILRLRTGFMQSRDCAVMVRHFCCVCTTIIEPFKFPLYIKVRDVHNKPLQLRCHLQCWACISLSSPHTRSFWEVRQLGETPFPSVWVRAQRDPRPVECPRSRHHHL